MDRYGLIGYPLKHSFSYKFFSTKFEAEKINAVYNNYEIDKIEQIVDIIKNNKDIKGLNVTIPYKEQIIPFLNELDDTAKKIRAVNVIKIERTNNIIHLKGYNSDLIGFRESIKPLINKDIHSKALILGTGGASKAVYYGLLQLGIMPVYVSRTIKENSYTYSQLNEDIMKEHQIIINASPIGTFPNVKEYPDIPYQYISGQHLLYDLVYNPSLTTFLKKGEDRGATIKNGYEMLELQALAAWQIWNT